MYRANKTQLPNYQHVYRPIRIRADPHLSPDPGLKLLSNLKKKKKSLTS